MKMMGAITAAPARPPGASEEWRMGEMLRSAIRHGGPLDEMDWPGWMQGVQDGVTITGTLMAIDLAPREEGHRHKRWFADPITSLLIIKWHDDGLHLPRTARPADCLGLVYAQAPAGVGAKLLSKSREAWSYRIPGLVLAYASGEISTASAPRSTWERVVYGRSVPDEIEPAKPASKVFAQRRPGLSADFNAIKYGGQSARFASGVSAVRSSKMNARTALLAMPVPADPVHRALREWSIFALQNAPGRKSKGYASGTVTDYLEGLQHVLANWDRCPLSAATASLSDHLHDALCGIADERLMKKAASGLRSFLAFINSRRDLPIELDLSEYLTERASVIDIALPETFARVDAALIRAGEPDLADMAMLMFRSGLRADEVLVCRRATSAYLAA